MKLRLIMFSAAIDVLTLAQTDASAKEAAEQSTHSAWSPAVNPKPLSEPVKRGLRCLVENQHGNGGWSQGEESVDMGTSMQQLKGIPNVADTCIATLALIREGSTPRQG